MTDTLSPEQRSQLMAKIHGKDTAIEKKVRSYLHKKGYRFRKHVARLPGSPDIVLPKYKVAIFIHGCFWHGHSGCRKSRLPSTRTDFWCQKVATNQRRDRKKIADLMNSGWRVAVVWQCALERSENFRAYMENLMQWIPLSLEQYEIPCPQKP